MHTSKASRGVPLPSFWQIVVMGAVVCVGWLAWKDNASKEDQDRAETEAESDDPVASLHAVQAFIRSGAAAVPRLTVELSASDGKSRALAAWGLAQIGPDAVDALDAVRERLADDNPRVRANALLALRTITDNSDEAGRVAARMLADPDGEVRDVAARQLRLVGARATKFVLERLEDDLPAARVQAVRVLRGWRPPDPEWLAEISKPVRKLLNDPDSGVRTAALTAIVTWGIAESEEIRELLHHEDVARVEIALRVVSGMGDGAAEFLPDVVELIDRLELDTIPAQGNHTIPSPMRRILSALNTMKTAARPAAPRLIRLLEARHDYMRTPVAETLAKIGTETEDLVRVLTPLLLDEDQGVAYEAGRLLIEVSPSAARGQVSRLMPKLGSGSSVNRPVLFALHALGPQAHEAAPAVAPLVKNPDAWVSDFAKQVLNDIGANPETALPAPR
jgi:HEAT repeat protein